MAKLKAKQVCEGYDVIVRLIGKAEADRRLGADGRRIVSEAKAKVAGKAMLKALNEAQLRTSIVEALTVAAAPKGAPGAGAAPSAGDGDGGLFATLASSGVRESPFWQTPGTASGAPVSAPAVPSKPPHQMDADELRAHGKAALGAHAQARGFGSPVWQ